MKLWFLDDILPFSWEKSVTTTSHELQLTLGIGLLLLISTWRLCRSSQTSQNQNVKLAATSSTALPFLGSTWDLVKNVHRFHDWMTDQCILFDGQPWLMQALGRPDVIVVSSVEAMEDVTKRQFDNFERGEYAYDVLKDMFGDGILTLDGDKWAHHRKIANQLFTLRTLKDSMAYTIQKYSIVLNEIFEEAAETKITIDLYKLFTHFTTEAFAEIGFGIQMNGLRSKEEHPFQSAFEGAQKAIIARLMAPVWLWKLQRWLGVGLEGQLQRCLKILDTIVYDIISQSLEHHTKNNNKGGDTKMTRTDLVSLFLEQVTTTGDDQEYALNPKYLRDMVFQFLLAGRDTTAEALSWFFFELSRHPEVEEKIRDEVKAKIPGLMSGEITSPSMVDVQQLTYLEAALKETLRLYPSAPFNARDAAHDTVLSDGTFVPAGTRVGLPIYGMARMPSIWGPDAAVFNPERWFDPVTNKPIVVSSFKFMSFHAGPRSCIGMNLAMLEMKIAVAQLLSKFHVKVVPGQHTTYEMAISLPMNAPFLVHVEKL